MALSRAFGPSGGVGWIFRVSSATLRIFSRDSPRSNSQLRICSCADDVAHQGDISLSGSIPNIASNFRYVASISRSSGEIAFPFSLSFTGLFSGIWRWIAGLSGDGLRTILELGPSPDSITGSPRTGGQECCRQRRRRTNRPLWASPRGSYGGRYGPPLGCAAIGCAICIVRPHRPQDHGRSRAG